MSLAEYHRLPFSLAWKQEYINGCLVESCREVVVHATVPVERREIRSQLLLREIRDADERALLPCFRAAFADAFEFCDYTTKQFAESAHKSLHHFFQGPFHRVLPASRGGCKSLPDPLFSTGDRDSSPAVEGVNG